MRILITLLLLASTAFGQGKTAPAQGPPPRNLTQQTDGRFSANADPANPEGFQSHVVRTGDTLSQIAGQVMNNSRLWPQLWEYNEHIINPHWIYPDDTILIRPVTQITEALPPAAGEPGSRAGSLTRLGQQTIQVPSSGTQRDAILLTPPPLVPEVKVGDLYCSGFIRTAPIVQNDFKVISKFSADGSVLATEADYIYLSQGSEAGVTVGATYQVIRPTKRIDNPSDRTGERDLGLHYLEVAQIRVVIAQAAFALGRVIHNCEAVEVGDLMIPFQRIELPPITRHRPFSPFMTASGQMKGFVVSTKESLLNFGSSFKVSGTIPGIRKGNLAPLERGIATEGSIAYVDLGQGDGVRAGDVLIVYRNIELSSQQYKLPKEIKKLENERTAIGELIVLKVGERASTALVTYATVGVSQGDAVERR